MTVSAHPSIDSEGLCLKLPAGCNETNRRQPVL